MPSINHGYQKQEDGSMTLIDLAVKAENAIMSDGSTAEEKEIFLHCLCFLSSIGCYWHGWLWLL